MIDYGAICDGIAGCAADCKSQCGNKQIESPEECDGSANCGTDCTLICGNGKIDSDKGEVCDGVTGCTSSCQAEADYLCFANNTCSKCGNGKVDDAAEECDSVTGCTSGCKA